MSEGSNRCIFCGDLAMLTSEHVWGEWIKKYVSPTMNKHGSAHVYVRRPGEPDAPIITRKAGDPVMTQVEEVCEKCNTGFLSQIQNRAKPYLLPLFEGKPSRLDEAAQSIIASWIAMTTMTASYSIRGRERIAISQSDRDWLRSTLTAPKDWRIWIGHCEEWARKEQWVHVTLPIFDSENIPETVTDNDRLPNTQTTAFKIGKLYAFSMSCPFPTTLFGWDWRTYPRAILFLHEIWPRAEGRVVAWPFARMATRDAEGIARAFLAYIEDLASREGYI
jgi:hypothetical protein